MHFRYNLNHIIAIALIAFYLILPAGNPAHAVSHENNLETFQVRHTCAGLSAALPCQNCPDSDQNHTCCEIHGACACQALFSNAGFIYSPIITPLNFPEPAWSLPQVYRRIYVPPQNTGMFADASDKPAAISIFPITGFGSIQGDATK